MSLRVIQYIAFCSHY